MLVDMPAPSHEPPNNHHQWKPERKKKTTEKNNNKQTIESLVIPINCFGVNGLRRASINFDYGEAQI